jgi:hypothetical protein
MKLNGISTTRNINPITNINNLIAPVHVIYAADAGLLFVV